MRVNRAVSARRRILLGLGGLPLLCLGLAGASAVSNLFLPTRSTLVDRLSELEKARVAEARHLLQTLGNSVWPGWGEQAIPMIVYNEQYAFLVGYADPPAGWLKVPADERRGGPWEPVPGDRFQGQVYYRQLLPDPAVTPEAFTVLVGERWVASLPTKEFMEIGFYAGFREEMPAPLRAFVPYRLIWGFLGGETDAYLAGLAHEAFHAFQGRVAEDRLRAAEWANGPGRDYPWDDPDLARAWQEELDWLVRAAQSDSDAEALELASRFLDRREARRADAALSAALIDYERQREWLEGLAKYAELALTRAAGATEGYAPLAELAADPAFKHYRTRDRFFSQQLDEARRLAGREGETRFYYAGFAQAVLLDRLRPGWKEQIFSTGIMIEDLLREAVRSSGQ